MKGQWSQGRAVFIVILLALCLVFLFVRRPAVLPDGFMATPAPSPSPTPTATAQPVSTPLPGAMTVCIGEAPIVTLRSEEEVRQLLAVHLQRYDALLPEGEMPLYTEFTEIITLREAQLGEKIVSIEQAQELLEGAPSLCPVRTRTRAVESEALAFDSAKTEDERIPLGGRIVLQVGRTGYNRVITTRTYVNGQLQGEPEVETDTLPPIGEKIAVGVHQSSSSKPGKSEGERGKKAGEGFVLELPFEGEILSNFGMREGKMHNGLDIDCKVGDQIVSPADGTVLFVGERSSYGLVVEIGHGSGFVSRLTSLQEVTLKRGDQVVKGQAVGCLAPPQDDEAEPHLHWELLIDGIPYNPRYYL